MSAINMCLTFLLFFHLVTSLLLFVTLIYLRVLHIKMMNLILNLWSPHENDSNWSLYPCFKHSERWMWHRGEMNVIHVGDALNKNVLAGLPRGKRSHARIDVFSRCSRTFIHLADKQLQLSVLTEAPGLTCSRALCSMNSCCFLKLASKDLDSRNPMVALSLLIWRVQH